MVEQMQSKFRRNSILKSWKTGGGDSHPAKKRSLCACKTNPDPPWRRQYGDVEGVKRFVVGAKKRDEAAVEEVVVETRSQGPPDSMGFPRGV